MTRNPNSDVLDILRAQLHSEHDVISDTFNHRTPEILDTNNKLTSDFISHCINGANDPVKQFDYNEHDTID